MHRKTSLKSYPLLNAISMGASLVSLPTSLEKFDRCNLYINCTGTPTGVLTVQYSPDYDPNKPSASATWIDLSFGLTALSGSPQDYVIDIVETSIPWIRVKYVRSSGTGAITAIVSGKES